MLFFPDVSPSVTAQCAPCCLSSLAFVWIAGVCGISLQKYMCHFSCHQLLDPLSSEGCASPPKPSFEFMPCLWAGLQAPLTWQQHQAEVQARLQGWHKAGRSSWKCTLEASPPLRSLEQYPVVLFTCIALFLCENLL